MGAATIPDQSGQIYGFIRVEKELGSFSEGNKNRKVRKVLGSCLNCSNEEKT